MASTSATTVTSTRRTRALLPRYAVTVQVGAGRTESLVCGDPQPPRAELGQADSAASRAARRDQEGDRPDRGPPNGRTDHDEEPEVGRGHRDSRYDQRPHCLGDATGEGGHRHRRHDRDQRDQPGAEPAAQDDRREADRRQPRERETCRREPPPRTASPMIRQANGTTSPNKPSATTPPNASARSTVSSLASAPNRTAPTHGSSRSQRFFGGRQARITYSTMAKIGRTEPDVVVVVVIGRPAEQASRLSSSGRTSSRRASRSRATRGSACERSAAQRRDHQVATLDRDADDGVEPHEGCGQIPAATRCGCGPRRSPIARGWHDGHPPRRAALER